MDNKNIREEIVKISYDIAKGNFIKDLFYVTETEKAIKFKTKSEDKFCDIPKTYIQNGWKKDMKNPQNIYLKSYSEFLRIFWRRLEK